MLTKYAALIYDDVQGDLVDVVLELDRTDDNEVSLRLLNVPDHIEKAEGAPIIYLTRESARLAGDALRQLALPAKRKKD